MDGAEIYRQLATIFQEILDDDAIAITSTTTTADLAEWDSYNHINLIVATERHFDIKFQTAELDGLRSVAEIVAAIERKLDAPRP